MDNSSASHTVPGKRKEEISWKEGWKVVGGVAKASKDKDAKGRKYGRSHTKSKIYPGRERVK